MRPTAHHFAPRLVVIATSIILAAAALAGERLSVQDALKDGKVTVALESVDDGKNATVTITSIDKVPLALIFSKGPLEFDVSTPYAKNLIVISVVAPKSIDLGPEKSASLTMPQAGKARIKSGKVTFRKTADGMSKSFENLTLTSSQQ